MAMITYIHYPIPHVDNCFSSYTTHCMDVACSIHYAMQTPHDHHVTADSAKLRIGSSHQHYSLESLYYYLGSLQLLCKPCPQKFCVKSKACQVVEGSLF